MPSEGPGHLWKLGIETLSPHYAVGKRTKNNPPLLEWQEWIEITTLWEKIKKWLLNKRDDIEYKKVKRFAMGFVAVHFDQFLANLVRVWFG